MAHSSAALSITSDDAANDNARLRCVSHSNVINQASNRVGNAAGSAVGYTATGNVNAIAGSAFTYNKANQLASIATGNSLYYDFLGWRLKAVTSGPSTYIDAYTPSGGLMAAIANGAEYDYVYLDDTLPVAAVKPSTSTVSAIHTSNLGTPQKLTSAAKAIVWGLAMQPYGNGTANPSTVQQDLRFPGQAVESGGFFFNLYRDYNPGWGRYLQADPIGIAGGLNPYNYVLNNPYKNIDPWGLDTQYFVSVGGTIAVMGGAGGGVTVGVSVPDKPKGFFDWQLFFSGQGNALLGAGAYAGYGINAGVSSSNGSLPSFSAAWQPYFEAGIGLGALSAGGSIQGDAPASSCTVNIPNTTKAGLDNPSYSASVPGIRIGQGVGIYVGAGGAGSITLASPSLNNIFGDVQR